MTIFARIRVFILIELFLLVNSFSFSQIKNGVYGVIKNNPMLTYCFVEVNDSIKIVNIFQKKSSAIFIYKFDYLIKQVQKKNQIEYLSKNDSIKLIVKKDKIILKSKKFGKFKLDLALNGDSFITKLTNNYNHFVSSSILYDYAKRNNIIDEYINLSKKYDFEKYFTLPKNEFDQKLREFEIEFKKSKKE